MTPPLPNIIYHKQQPQIRMILLIINKMYVKKHKEEDYSDFGKQQKRLYNAQINASLSQNQVFKEYLIRLTFQQQEN